MATIKEFEDLEIWKLSRILCNDIFKLASNSELSSDYKLFNQLNGSSGSIMDNIAEGYERNGNKEFIQYLSYCKSFLRRNQISVISGTGQKLLILKTNLKLSKIKHW